METAELQENTKQDFDLVWNKRFSYLVLNKVHTTISLDHEVLAFNKQNHILGLIRTSPKEQKLPLRNLSHIKLKKSINLFDMLLGTTFIVLGFANPLFFILAIVSYWAGISTKIEITTN